MRNREGGRSGTVESARQAVLAELPRLAELTPGEQGSLSARVDDHFVITPADVPYREVEPSDVAVLRLSGTTVGGDADPAEVSPMHAGVYRGLDVGAIAHTHSPWATTLAVVGEPLPPVHYMVGMAGAEVPVAGYASYGSGELAMNVVEAMTDVEAEACLIANHGVVATGDTVADAVETAQAIESVARIYCQSKMLDEEPDLLPEPELNHAARKLSSDGGL